jgi:hypothetical protein
MFGSSQIDIETRILKFEQEVFNDSLHSLFEYVKANSAIHVDPQSLYEYGNKG